MSVWAAKIARLASAEGEEDAGILQHHRAYVLLAEAAAILRAGSSARHRAQAAEKMLIALSTTSVLESDVFHSYDRACGSSSFAADAADVGATAATFMQYLDAISVMLVAKNIEDDDKRRQSADQITTLLEQIRAGPQAVDESLRRLGTTLTAARLEYFSLEGLVDMARLGDPLFPQTAAFARRQAFPCAACSRSAVG
jgi:hypothetical protein